MMFATMVALGVLIATPNGSATADGVDVTTSRTTGVASFVSAADGGTLSVQASDARAPIQAMDVLLRYGHLFGISAPLDELALQKVETDAFGYTHTTFQQVYEGVPVFAGLMRVHVNAEGEAHAINGTFIPDIKLDRTPRLTAEEAAGIAVASVLDQLQRQTELNPVSNSLMVFRANLARGIPGPNHLVYQVEVGNGTDVREFVYVDAHTGKVVDQITGIHDAIRRRIFIGDLETLVLFWEEGDVFPTGIDDVDNQIAFAEDVYNLVASATNGAFHSWDGGDAVMDSVLIDPDPFFVCPNAFWNGVFTAYCPGVTADDTVAHEWGHAYTQSTHNLIYQWQPGALNESYSDIFGEVADLLNGAGIDAPAALRNPDKCSTFGSHLAPVLEILAPPSIARRYASAGAVFNPSPPITVSGDIALADDGNDEGGTASIHDACQPLIGFPGGRIAIIDRGTCPFTTKVHNAATAGAVGVIMVNNEDGVFTMSGAELQTIPSVMMAPGDGGTIKSAMLVQTVTATLALLVPTGAEDSLRWLAGEDDPAFGGAIRDLWNPTCFGDPGKVSDTGLYFCGTLDAGGVHTNSGIPNHAFALLVDGGTYNGQTITGIGLTKTFHIYWRAESVYQVPATNFADHADALEQSCTDLIGMDLFALSTEVPTGTLSGETINAADCAELSKAIAAVELRFAPTHCDFQPLLSPDAPALCADLGFSETLFTEDWESGLGAWSVGTRNVAKPSTFSTADWAAVGDLPGDRKGSAAFVADLIAGDCDTDIEAGVLFLESPGIVFPAGGIRRVAFDHWVATEFGWDGANVKAQVNGGPWILVPSVSYTFNPYNIELVSPSDGNDNPMAGEEAFSGTDGGSVEGSWGQSHIDLSGIAAPGDVVRLRFELGVDGCGGAIGWYVDIVRAVLCVTDCADGCAVEGECRDEGEVNPANACEVCDATADPNGWSARPYGTPCETDANLCTIDECDGDGACVTMQHVACPAPIPPCEGGAGCNSGTGACDPLPDASAGTPCGDSGDTVCDHSDTCDGTGLCASNFEPDGTLCPDALFCNGEETCASGVCTDRVDPCIDLDHCDDGLDRCVCTLDTECDDGLPCTTGRCEGSACVFDLNADWCLIDESCHNLGTINPLNACETCDPAVDPNVWSPRGTGAECDDDVHCNGTDTCDGDGVCGHVGNPCSPRLCDEDTRTCFDCAGDADCDDGIACTTGSCVSGACFHVPVPDWCFIDGECHIDGTQRAENDCEACDAATSPSAWSPRAADTACEADGNLCTNDECDGAGTCVTFDTVTCSGSASPCGGGSVCNPATGVCDAQPAPASGTSCNTDNNLCTIDQCDGSGACVKIDTVRCQAPQPPCEGGEACNPSTGTCEVEADAVAGTACEADNNLCSIDECDGLGECLNIGDVVCPAPDPPCEGGAVCIPGTGVCASQPDALAGSPCDDDGNDCTRDICDGSGACSHPDRQDGTRCDDGLFCNGADACVGGECQSAGDPCAADGLLCDEDNDVCACDENTRCDDGLFCTGVESCVDRACRSSGDPCAPLGLVCDEADAECRCNDDGDCDDGIDTNLDRCILGEGTCLHGELIVQGVATMTLGAIEFYAAHIILEDGTEEDVSDRVTWRALSGSEPGTLFFACTISETGILTCPRELVGGAIGSDGEPVDVVIEARVREPSGELVATQAVTIVPGEEAVGQPLPTATASPRCGACGSFGLIGPVLLLFGFLGLRTDVVRRSLRR